MDFSILKKNPFYLNDAQIQWVKDTLEGMTQEQKAGQLLCVNGLDCSDEVYEGIFSKFEPGGIMYRAGKMEKTIAFTRRLSQESKIPLLIAGNLEKGGNGMITGGTMLGAPLGVAATGEVQMAEKLGTICAREGAAIGANWAFAPIIDIDYNWRNPITNTRTFGSDPKLVASMGSAYVKHVQEGGVAACIKHFPGDGRDERDQHLCTTVNDMDCEEWMDTYGAVYRSCIEAGALTCMAGQIMQPAWTKRLNPQIQDADIRPASQSPELLQGLLREKLGFNGLICTDSTTMAGFIVTAPRSESVPGCIAAGADMMLFNKNLQEDYDYMLAGIRNGVITPKRLDEAVTRILGVKAALHLNEKRPMPAVETAEKIVGCREHRVWERECADKAITLVKEEEGVLPITPKRYPRILLYPMESHSEATAGNYGAKDDVIDKISDRLRKLGFEVTWFERDPNPEGFGRPTCSYAQNYDLCLYVANMATKSNQTVVRLEWAQPMGANCPHFITSIPTVFVSVENPYHLVDVPRIRTFINAYSSNDATLELLVDKLTGKSEFKGKSPTDVFCGKWDTHL